jgi:two-component system invasion response regulator UvrY
MQKISILIVDDHQLLRETWRFVLNHNENLNVIADCEDGRKAIDIVKRKKPNIVLLDIEMPLMNGFDTLKELKQYLDSKVICISTHNQASYVREMIQRGAFGYVTKNSCRQEMIKAIIEVHQGRKYICEDVKNVLAKQVLIGDGLTSPLLSKREIQVLNFIKDGLTSAQISNALEITIATVHQHRNHILKKFKLNNMSSIINQLYKNRMF